MAFIKALGLLDEEARRFIKAVSELRNNLVHDIAQVDFSFAEHITLLDRQQKTNFLKSFGYFANGETFELSGESFDTSEFMLVNPKKGVWFSVMALCSVIYLSKEHVALRKIIAELKSQIEAGPKRGT
ncbi:MAG: hypothetical protein HND55_00800 [Pseudomonadota bacterium]|nr:MAG: hypothetical protein HND55_00800 [Pseudomonadota bacterium]